MPLEAYETLQIIRDGMKNLQFASLPAVVKTAQSLTKEVDRLTNAEMAGLISKDPFATASVLEMANKGSKAESLDRANLEEALLAMGYKKLKGIVFQLLDMEAAKDKLRFPEQIEASAEGLVSCIMAEEIYRRGFFHCSSKLKMADLYSITILRSYGRILMSSFCIDNFRTAINMAATQGEKKAFTEIFGITPIDLTRDLLRETKISKDIVKTIKPFDSAIFQAPVIKQHEEYMILAEFALRLTVILFDFRVTAKKVEGVLQDLVNEFGSIVKMEVKDCMDLLFPLSEEITKIEAKYEVEVVPPYIPTSIECRQAGRDLPKIKASAKKKKNDQSKPPEERLMAGAEEVEFAAKKRPLMSEKLYASLCDLIHNSLAMNETIIFEENDDMEYVPAYGAGDMFKFLAKRERYEPSDNEVLGMCIRNNCDALIFDTNNPKVKPHIHRWMEVDMISSAFLMFVKIERPFILVAMKKDGASIQLPGPVIKALTELKLRAYMALDGEHPKDLKTKVDLRTFNTLLKK